MHVRELRAGAQQASAAAILASGLKLAISLPSAHPRLISHRIVDHRKAQYSCGFVAVQEVVCTFARVRLFARKLFEKAFGSPQDGDHRGLTDVRLGAG